MKDKGLCAKKIPGSGVRQFALIEHSGDASYKEQHSKFRNRSSNIGNTEERETSPLIQAQEAAKQTQDLLESQGWCLWKCAALDNEIIVVERDETVENIPEGFLVYTEDELLNICNSRVSESMFRLIHEIKKHGARLTAVR